MKYIYEVSIKQHYDYYSSKSLFKKREKLKSDVTYLWDHLILAENEDKAVEIYDKRYNWKDSELSPFLTFMQDRNNFELIRNELVAKKLNPTFNYLKENMRADDFLEYCKQELYPIEVIMK